MVQSTDKVRGGGHVAGREILHALTTVALARPPRQNFMVPVGGAIVAAGKRLPGLVDAVNKLYPGRAAVNAHLDLAMTLLHWGAGGWRGQLRAREELRGRMRARLEAAAAAVGERLLLTPGNPISFAVTLDSLRPPPLEEEARDEGEDPPFLGSMLWAR